MRHLLLVLVLTGSVHADPADAYHELEHRLGAPRDDAGTALTILVVGCYVAYTGAPIPHDDQIAALRKQLAPKAAAELAPYDATKRAQAIQYMGATGLKLLVGKTKLKADAERMMATLKLAPAELIQTIEAITNPKPDPSALRKQLAGFVEVYRKQFDGAVFSFVEDTYLLVASGWTTTSPDAALDPAGFDAHRAAHPDQWKQWRKHGKGIELCAANPCDGRWTALTSEVGSAAIEPLLPKGFRLAGHYWSVTGGTAAHTTVANFDDLTFDATGRFTTSNTSGVSSKSVVGATQRTGEQGTYDIDGIILTLHFDDGRTSYRMFAAENTRAPKALAIGGRMYVPKK